MAAGTLKLALSIQLFSVKNITCLSNCTKYLFSPKRVHITPKSFGGSTNTTVKTVKCILWYILVWLSVLLSEQAEHWDHPTLRMLKHIIFTSSQVKIFVNKIDTEMRNCRYCTPLWRVIRVVLLCYKKLSTQSNKPKQANCP